MKVPERPVDEGQRVRTLRGLEILDTSAEERFDRFTRLARRLFQVPIALVSLVDSERQWFKSRQGLDVSQTPRDISFCGHAILEEDPLIIPDASSDPRFRDNPLVRGEPHIRFYAGYPLSAPDGSKLGTLCIIDREPRQLTDADRQVLLDLGGMVQDELIAAHLATTDSLTGLSNRRGFERMAQKVSAVCARSGASMALLFFDLDGLKQINDRFGHGAGDHALASFAQLLLDSFRSSDVIARMGGDEFCVLLTGVQCEKLDLVVQRFEQRVAARNAGPGVDWPLAFSCGVISCDERRHDSIPELLAEADRRMYEQKRQRDRGPRRA